LSDELRSEIVETKVCVRQKGRPLEYRLARITRRHDIRSMFVYGQTDYRIVRLDAGQCARRNRFHH
jgi:hypothetical protein